MTQSAADILKAALGHMEDRAATYDKPEGERSMPATVEAFNAVTGLSLTAEQGWLFCVLLKAVRSQQGGYRADNYDDGAAYFALMGEQASGDRKECEAKSKYPTWATHMLESLGSTWYVRACGPKGWEAIDEALGQVRYFNESNTVAGSLKPLPKKPEKPEVVYVTDLGKEVPRPRCRGK